VSDDHHDSHPADEFVTARQKLSALRERHRQMLILSVAALALSGLLVTRSDDRVALWFLPDWPAPETCLARSGLGIPCPGCGLTRSFIALAHLDFDAAWKFHRLGWLLAAATVAQIPYRLWGMSHPRGLPLGSRWPKMFGSVLIVALLVHGVMRWCGL